MTVTSVLSVLASITIIGVIVSYFRQVVRGESVPNPATWFVWTVAGFINSISFFTVVDGNLWEWFFTIFTTLGPFTTFVYALATKKMAKVGWVEVLSLVCIIITLVVWYLTGDDVWANLLVQGVYLISFVPTAIGVWNGEKEKAFPWGLSLIAYGLLICTILLGWDDGSTWHELAHPVLNGIVGNGSVWLLILLCKPREDGEEEIEL